LGEKSDMMRIFIFGVFLLACDTVSKSATVSELFGRGYTVIPAPQKVNLAVGDFEFNSAWRLELGPGIQSNDISVESLKDQLRERFRLTLGSSEADGPTVHLLVDPHAVTVEKSALADQAYRLDLSAKKITITGNTATGAFYGVQTLIQLLKTENGTLWLPKGQIEDWPDLELRVMYWDDAHHLEHPNVLKAALRQASFYKINGFSIKLEGHFQYQHAHPIVEPYALTPAELQELTDYGLKYHVQLIPYLDGPAHDAFILKHPEYAALREYADSNYEFCATNPKTYQLFEGMFEDLLNANKGGKYFVLSTDEPYYVGLADNDQCHEADRAKKLGSVGKLLAEFVTKTAAYLHEHGRTVIFWGEYPMKPEDIDSLPSYLVNGELYGPQFDPVFRAHGIKQMIYTSTAGEEQLFPRYYPGSTGPGRLQEMFDQASFTSLESLSSTRPDSAQPRQADLTGIFVAGWGDPGLHPETFWLGYVAGTAPAWHQASPNPQELRSSFFPLFYGSRSSEMGRLYQLMCEQAQFWEDSWEVGPSSARAPIWGNSFGVFNPPRPAHDQFLSPLPVPSPELLRLSSDWRLVNETRLGSAGVSLEQNDQLIDLLETNISRVEFNRYNLEVYLSIAGLYRQNLLMLQDLGRISDALKAAEAAAAKSESIAALVALDRALDIARNVQQNRNQALQNATETWYQSWFPRVLEANGRHFLNVVDDVKDHQPARTSDMTYLVYRELLYPLGDWAAKVVAVRNQYATAHQKPVRQFGFDWRDTSSIVSAQRKSDDSDN